MLGLAQFQHEVGKRKKKIYSITLVCLLVFSGLLGAFITFRDTSVFAALPFSDGFETSTEGQPPNGWEGHVETGSGNITTNATIVYAGSKSVHVVSSVIDTAYSYYNLTSESITEAAWYLSCYVNVTDTSTDQLLIGISDKDKEHAVPQNNYYIHVKGSTTDYWGFSYKNNGETTDYSYGTITASYGEWTHVVLTGLSNGSIWLYIDDVVSNHYNVGATGDDDLNFTIMGEYSTGSGCSCYFDDVVVNNSVYTPPASGYPEINDTVFNASLTNVGGVYSITFSGSQGETVWCNSSGSGSENMTVSISDGNQSVTWINVSLSDVGTSPDVDAEDFYLYASESVASGYVAISAFPIGGGNVTVNATTWTGVDPFPISGADIVYFRFKLTIDADQTNQTYTETTGCKVYIGG